MSVKWGDYQVEARDETLCTGWLPLVGSLKLYVSFAKEPYRNRRYSAKETYNFKEPTNRSHPIPVSLHKLIQTIHMKDARISTKARAPEKENTSELRQRESERGSERESEWEREWGRKRGRTRRGARQYARC